MATLDQILAGLIEFRDTVYSRFDEIEEKMESLKLRNLCTVCHGTGEVNDSVDGEAGPPYECPQCGGDGTVKIGDINSVSDEPI